MNREYSPHLHSERPLLPMPVLPAPAFPLPHSSMGSTHLISLQNLTSSRCLPCQLLFFLSLTYKLGVLTSSPFRSSPPPDASFRFSSTSLINWEYLRTSTSPDAWLASSHFSSTPLNNRVYSPPLPAPTFPLLHSSIGSTHLISLENLPSSQCLPCQLPLFL